MLDIESIFSYHEAKQESVRLAHEQIRLSVKMSAYDFQAVLPESPEKTLAIRYLQIAMMFANSAIAQYGVNDGESSN